MAQWAMGVSRQSRQSSQPASKPASKQVTGGVVPLLHSYDASAPHHLCRLLPGGPLSRADLVSPAGLKFFVASLSLCPTRDGFPVFEKFFQTHPTRDACMGVMVMGG